MLVYPKQAEELVQLLQEDQEEWRNFARADFEATDKSALEDELGLLRQRVRQRAGRMLQILNEIDEPTLTNIGTDAAKAMFVLAQHDSLTTIRQVLAAFTRCYERQRDNTYYQAIPPMTDWMLILQHKPQQFGTIWLMDENKEPFLPTVEDFEHVNERRAEYDIEPLHWPKSLAIPESKQPWLKRPLSELVMRDPIDKEYNDFAQNYVS